MALKTPENLAHVENYDIVIQRAVAATEREKQMRVWDALKTYPKAVGWSMVLSSAIIMEGFDLVLIGSFFAFTPFNQKYGRPLSDGTYQVPAQWQTALTNGALVGSIIGLISAGFLTERYGYRKTMVMALSCMMAVIFVPFFAPNVAALTAGEVLCGIPWGIFQGLAPSYAADICPVALRGYLTTYINICFVTGQLLSSGILRAFISRGDQWSFRIPFALQWIWPLPILIGCLFAPESPWWFIRRNNVEKARSVLQRLQKPRIENADQYIDDTLEMMRYTNDIEKKETEGMAFQDCFKKTDLRRTEIACFAYASQMICGSSLMNYSIYFYQQAGVSTLNAANFSLGQFSIGFLGTIVSWWLMLWFGRRTLYLAGATISFTLLIVMGILATAHQTTATAWATGSILLALTFAYDCTLGPLGFCIVSEIPSTRLRMKTIMLARSVYNISGIICNILTPRMLNPTAWGWVGKAGFFWGGICGLCMMWIYFRLPEAKGRTYGELDILFENKVSARKFSDTNVDQLEGAVFE